MDSHGEPKTRPAMQLIFGVKTRCSDRFLDQSPPALQARSMLRAAAALAQATPMSPKNLPSFVSFTATSSIASFRFARWRLRRCAAPQAFVGPACRLAAVGVDESALHVVLALLDHATRFAALAVRRLVVLVRQARCGLPADARLGLGGIAAARHAANAASRMPRARSSERYAACPLLRCAAGRRHNQETTMATRSNATARNQVLNMLKQDHKRAQQAFRDFSRMDGEDDEERCRALVEQTCAELEVHAQLEEELFYPAARSALAEDGEDLMNEADVEHMTFKMLIEQLKAMGPEDEKYGATVAPGSRFGARHAARLTVRTLTSPVR